MRARQRLSSRQSLATRDLTRQRLSNVDEYVRVTGRVGFLPGVEMTGGDILSTARPLVLLGRIRIYRQSIIHYSTGD
jgi:hypothetical protein